MEKLNKFLHIVIKNGYLGELFEELIVQCKIEYNILDDVDEDEDEE